MNECITFRKQADDPDGIAPFQKHMEACDGCKRWHRQNEELGAIVNAMPQFDVSEALTQQILSAVEAQPRRHFAAGLLAPLAVGAGAICLTLMPIDTAEGLLSTAVAVAGLYLIRLVVKSAPHEESVA
jgi:hypothetical protein